ncbi:MAG: hypothetical protein KF779_18720 [Hyphomonadaceae bacterium]|nr:hypothetical protein [Hyphomonadaceae bacterium]
MKSLVSVCAAALLAVSCATAPDIPSQRERLTRQIADDAVSFNEAYGQAVSAQILLNILRSRDRMPRYYLAMTGISDSPSWSTTQSAAIGGIPLGGDVGTPWGVGGLGVERERASRPSYAVQPFDAATLARTAFQPTPSSVFEHYWYSGWPRDLLMLMMVESIEKTDGGGHVSVFTNEANTIFDDCVARVQTGGCNFVREVRAFLDISQQHPSERGVDLEHGRPLCGLVEAYDPASAVRPATPRETQICEPAFVVGADTLRLRLRSLDDMVYYVGELLRAGGMQAAPGEAIEAQVTVRAAGLRGGGQGVPLFRIVPAGDDARGSYAAEITYGGERFRAGPAIGRSCGEQTQAGRCQDNAEEGDRSSSVLSLIAEILALNQSPDAIRAPSRLIAE